MGVFLYPVFQKFNGPTFLGCRVSLIVGHWGKLSNSDRRVAMTNLISAADETELTAPELTEEVAFVRQRVRLKGQCHMLALRLCRSDGGLQVHSSTRDLLADVIPAGVVATQQIQILCWEEKRDLLQQMLPKTSSSAEPMVSSLSRKQT